MRDFDALRAAFPDRGFAVYAYRPDEPVTLEVHFHDENVFEVKRATLAECIDALWPIPEPVAPPEPRKLTLFD